MTGKYLITTDAWFYGPDGRSYRAVWGEVKIVSDDFLGIKTNMRSSNWFARVGTDDDHVIVAGCQIHYACKRENKPNDEQTSDYEVINGFAKEFLRPSHIYIIESQNK